MLKRLTFSTLALLCSYSLSTQACSNIVLQSQDGTTMVGRTLEFGPNLNSQIMTSPEGKHFQSPSPSGHSGLNWNAKYGYVFLNFFGQNNAVDGVNEKGLSIGYLYLPGYTEYPTVPKGQNSKALSYLYLGDWLLGNFTSVNQAIQSLKKVDVYGNPQNFGSYKNLVFPLHMIITDSSGESATVEFHKGKMYVYQNKNGVMTNSPSYPWQVTNQLNYANLSPFSPKGGVRMIDGMPYVGTGQGSGAVGLPGDYTPPSRFTKLTFLTQYANTAKNASDLLNTEQHILNNVDITSGAVRGLPGDTTPGDTTQWTVFKDLKHPTLYFKSYDNTTLQKIDLSQLDFSKGAKQMSIPVSSPQYIIDATSKLK